jgi:hypothetical protein
MAPGGGVGGGGGRVEGKGRKLSSILKLSAFATEGPHIVKHRYSITFNIWNIKERLEAHKIYYNRYNI